jgi:hypothetical protein
MFGNHMGGGCHAKLPRATQCPDLSLAGHAVVQSCEVPKTHPTMHPLPPGADSVEASATCRRCFGESKAQGCIVMMRVSEAPHATHSTHPGIVMTRVPEAPQAVDSQGACLLPRDA